MYEKKPDANRTEKNRKADDDGSDTISIVVVFLCRAISRTFRLLREDTLTDQAAFFLPGKK